MTGTLSIFSTRLIYRRFTLAADVTEALHYRLTDTPVRFYAILSDESEIDNMRSNSENLALKGHNMQHNGHMGQNFAN